MILQTLYYLCVALCAQKKGELRSWGWRWSAGKAENTLRIQYNDKHLMLFVKCQM